MADAKPSIENILCCDKLPIVLVKSYELEAFVMGYHVYRKTWKPFVGQKLDTAMEPNNVMGKYAVAIFQERQKHVVGHLPLGHSGKYANTIFYFLKADKENSCKVIIHSKAVLIRRMGWG